MLRAAGVALMVVSGIAAIVLPELSFLWRHFPIAYASGGRGKRQMGEQRGWGDRALEIWRKWWPLIVGTFVIGLVLVAG